MTILDCHTACSNVLHMFSFLAVGPCQLPSAGTLQTKICQGSVPCARTHSNHVFHAVRAVGPAQFVSTSPAEKWFSSQQEDAPELTAVCISSYILSGIHVRNIQIDMTKWPARPKRRMLKMQDRVLGFRFREKCKEHIKLNTPGAFQEHSKSTRRALQKHAKNTPKAPKSLPRAPQEHPRARQEDSKNTPRAPEEHAKSTPREAQEHLCNTQL